MNGFYSALLVNPSICFN